MSRSRKDNDSQDRQNPRRQSQQTRQASGERVLEGAVRLAADRWGTRLVAAYALGSLAHGGFSVHVSDIDLGLVLSDPLEAQDAPAIEALANTVKAGGAPLAERLSIFWGSLATLSGAATGGRFPPLDRLDLKQWGRLLLGQDIRAQLFVPTVRELVIAGAEFALQVLSIPEVTAELRDPATLVNAGVIRLTKMVLFPVRLLFTARTGQIGRNEAAVEYFTAVETGPAADLARTGFTWREEPPDPSDPAVVDSLEKGLLPLYRLFLDEYAERLRQYGELELGHAFEQWRQRLT
jgi:predicted nucleotidyltransferase